jgi:hypothetical protein
MSVKDYPDLLLPSYFTCMIEVWKEENLNINFMQKKLTPLLQKYHKSIHFDKVISLIKTCYPEYLTILETFLLLQ